VMVMAAVGLGLRRGGVVMVMADGVGRLGRGGGRPVVVMAGLGDAGAEGDHGQGDANGSEKARHAKGSDGRKIPLAAFYTAARRRG